MSFISRSERIVTVIALLTAFSMQTATAAQTQTTTTTGPHSATTQTTTKSAVPPAPVATPAPPVVAAGDPVQGLKIFKGTCALCHLASKDNNLSDASMRIGPNLYGVIGRPAGTLKGFRYSSAMRNSGVTWTKDQLAIYIHAPQKTIPSVRMTFKGLASPKDAQDVIAYLDTLH